MLKATVVNSMFVKVQQHCVAILTDAITVIDTFSSSDNIVITCDAIKDIIQKKTDT